MPKTVEQSENYTNIVKVKKKLNYQRIWASNQNLKEIGRVAKSTIKPFGNLQKAIQDKHILAVPTCETCF